MRRVLSAVMLAALAFPAPAAAQQAASPAAHCTTIAADTERLACYDAMFRAPAGGPALPPVVIQSNQPIPARPSGRAPAVMTIACGTGGLGVGFSFAGQLLSETSDEAAISFQVQQTGSQIRSLPVGPDNTTIAFANARDADAFLETLESGDNLVVRITPVRQRSIQVQFNLRGREAEIAAVREGCGPQ